MYESYRKNERIAAEAVNRRGRLVGKEGGSDEAFGVGTVMCASCGDTVAAARTMVTGRGPVCEGCHYAADDRSVAGSVWLRVASAIGAAAGAWALLALLAYALSRATGPVGDGPLSFLLVAAGSGFAAGVAGVPLIRTARLEPEVSGLPASARVPIGLAGLGSSLAGLLALVTSAIVFLLL